LGFVLLLLLCSCVKTQEKLFTAADECKEKLEFSDPAEPKDEYDICVMQNDEVLKDISKCEERCQAYCDRLEMLFEKSYPDFAGCQCICKLKLDSN